MTDDFRPQGGRVPPRSPIEKVSSRFPNLLKKAFKGSLRTQLIVGNIVAVSLLVGGLGIACRFIILTYMLQSVDQELERSIGRYMHPPRIGGAGGGRDREPGPEPPPREAGFPHHGHRPDETRGDGKRPDAHDGQDGPPDGLEGHGPPDGEEERGGRQHPGPPPAGHARADHGPPGAEQTDNLYRPHLWTPEGKSQNTADTRPAWDANALARAQRGETLTRDIIFNDEPLRVLSAPGFNIMGKRGAVQAAYPLKEVDRATQGINTALLLMLPIGLLGAGWAGVALTNRVLKRVHGLTRAAGRIGAHDLSQRLPITGLDEFGELAETFNGLLGRLDSAFAAQKQTLEQQRRFTADASHELKTPLTIIRGQAGMSLARESTDERSRRAFEEINGAAQTMSHLVQDLLLLARSDEGGVAQDRVEILARELLQSAQIQSASGNAAPVMLRVTPDTLLVRGNQAELTRLFRNLLDNALRCTPSTGTVTLAAYAENESVVVTVSDTGAGIAAHHLPHLGERFYRVDESRTRPTGGTGLGLSICRSIADAHGGTMRFESTLGVGTTVTVTLPQKTDLPQMNANERE